MLFLCRQSTNRFSLFKGLFCEHFVTGRPARSLVDKRLTNRHFYHLEKSFVCVLLIHRKNATISCSKSYSATAIFNKLEIEKVHESRIISK